MNVSNHIKLFQTSSKPVIVQEKYIDESKQGEAFAIAEKPQIKLPITAFAEGQRWTKRSGTVIPQTLRQADSLSRPTLMAA